MEKTVYICDSWINAWKYLLTHDLTNAYPKNKDSEASISNEERDILWELVNWQEEWKGIWFMANKVIEGMGFHHIALKCKDIEKSLAMY